MIQLNNRLFNQEIIQLRPIIQIEVSLFHHLIQSVSNKVIQILKNKFNQFAEVVKICMKRPKFLVKIIFLKNKHIGNNKLSKSCQTHKVTDY